MSSSTPITRNDIKSKLSDIQTEATSTAEGAKTQIIAIGAGLGLLLLIVMFLLGRKGGMRKSTIIEVKRA